MPRRKIQPAVTLIGTPIGIEKERTAPIDQEKVPKKKQSAPIAL